VAPGQACGERISGRHEPGAADHEVLSSVSVTNEEERGAPSGQALVGEAEVLLEPAVALRRRLHAHPELGLDLPKTQEDVLDALDGLGLATTTGRTTSSVVAVLDGHRPGPTTLLRGDMDALPLPELTGLPFASEVEGAMHACGHDAHVAMLVGAAQLLVRHQADLAGRVVFMFQPGEEGFAGATYMLDEGLLSRFGAVDRAFAMHVTPMLPSGLLAGRAGPLMASADTLDVVITGKGGHASMPDQAVDPIPVAAEMVGAWQTMITRRVPAFDPAVITVASIHGGTTYNVTPDSVALKVTVRAASPQSRALALEGLRRVAEHVAAAHLCSAVISEAFPGYPVTVNDAAAVDHSLGVASSLFGQDRTYRMPAPVMGAEDWSFVLQLVPGSMIFLGAAPPGEAHPAPNHSSRMEIDEAAMATGIAMHAALALS
jgi:amidohydrolase